jgi:anti-sigma-K factor RskA
VNDRDRDLDASTGAYVLHALDADETAAFEEVLAHSETLRTEVVELADTVVEIGLAVPEVAPPAAMRSEVLARIADLPQLDESPIAPVAEIGERRAAASRRRRIPRPVAIIVPIAAAAALITAITTTVILPATPSGRVAAVTSASDVQTSTVRVQGGGTLRISWSDALDAAAVTPRDLPRLSGGRVYELWYIAGDSARAAGTFDGSGAVALDGRLAHGDRIGMTVEPAGGSTTPTSTPIAITAT